MATAAGSGVDYSYVLFKNIDSNSPSTPTVVNAVVVKCPTAGNLISTASAQITIGTFNGQAGEADVEFGILNNSVAAPINHHHLLRQYTGASSGPTYGTASFQRTDTCAAGQTVTMRFVVHRLSAAFASAEQSSLVVTFIGDPKI
ncbi:MAG: hypothetical protein PHO08_13775 [Methylococcales bacterium]|nr:hypothetical protein [Methylococcales bacterium]